jgi:hypothetical protein
MSYRVSDIRVLRIGNIAMRHSAPFTGEYFCHLPKSFNAEKESKRTCRLKCWCDGGVPTVAMTRRRKLKELNQTKDGWLFIDSSEVEGKNSKITEIGCAYKVKKWMYTTQYDGFIRTIGDPKMTYEVIADSGCSSYSLHKIPGYMMAINGLKEGNILLRELHRNYDNNDDTFDIA